MPVCSLDALATRWHSPRFGSSLLTSFATVALVLAMLGASWIPARQASRVEPAETLRVD
jgi:ABC-type lipoprotein release transport system permease subunit